MFDAEQLKRLLKEARLTIAWLSQPDHDEEKPQDYKNAADKENDEMTNETASDADLPSRSKPEPATNRKWYKSVDAWRFLLECFTFIAVVFAGIVYYGQWQAAKEQALLAGKQLSEMREQRLLDERAWVCPTEAVHLISVSNFNVFGVKMKNTGRTPAFNVKGTITVISRSNWDVVVSEIPTHDIPQKNLEDMIAPNKEFIIQTLEDTNNILTPHIQNHEFCYIYGTLWYDDVFKKHHWSQFCYTYRPEIFNSAGFHNATDDVEPDN